MRRLRRWRHLVSSEMGARSALSDSFVPYSADVRAWLTSYFTYRRARRNVNINLGLVVRPPASMSVDPACPNLERRSGLVGPSFGLRTRVMPSDVHSSLRSSMCCHKGKYSIDMKTIDHAFCNA